MRNNCFMKNMKFLRILPGELPSSATVEPDGIISWLGVLNNENILFYINNFVNC